jgi:chromosome partitioning protein
LPSALPTKQLHRRLRGLSGWAGYDVVIIDTPPQYPQEGEDPDAAPPPGIVHSALRAADLIVVPMAPTTMDLSRVRATLKAIENAGHPPGDVRFLLNQKVNRAGSTDAIRAVIVDGGSQVFQTEIKRLEVIAQGMGEPLPKQLHGYLSAAMELEKMK